MSLLARRFRCMAAACRRSIFTERFGDDVLAPHARRTARLDGLDHHLAPALGGRPTTDLTRRLVMPVSNDTLLRVLGQWCGRRASSKRHRDRYWAWKRSQRYGAIICDLERRRPIKLLPDREPATAQRGSQNSRNSLLSPETAVAALRSPPTGHCPMLSRSQIAGI